MKANGEERKPVNEKAVGVAQFDLSKMSPVYMEKLGCCFHPDSKLQGALPSKRRTLRCSWRVLVLSRRGDSQAHRPSWWRAGWQMRGGHGGGRIPGSACSDTAFQRLRGSCGVPTDRCASAGSVSTEKG